MALINLMPERMPRPYVCDARIIAHDSQDILKANSLISPESLQVIFRFSSDCQSILAAVQQSIFQGEARDVQQ
jgi:hypothetical protein